MRDNRKTNCVFCGWADPTDLFSYRLRASGHVICDACVQEIIPEHEGQGQGQGNYNSGNLQANLVEKNDWADAFPENSITEPENPMTEPEKVILDLTAKNNGIIATETLSPTKSTKTALAELAKRDYGITLDCPDGDYLVMKRAGWDAYNNDETL